MSLFFKTYSIYSFSCSVITLVSSCCFLERLSISSRSSFNCFSFLIFCCLSFSSFVLRSLSICCFLLSDLSLNSLASASYCFFFLVVSDLSAFIFCLVSFAFLGFLSIYCSFKAITLFPTFLSWYPVSAFSFLASFFSPAANCFPSSNVLANKAFPLSHKLSAVTSLSSSITASANLSVLMLSVFPSRPRFIISS